MNLTALDLRREYGRGRADTIILTLLGTLFLSMPIMSLVAAGAFDNGWLGFFGSIGLASWPIIKNRQNRSMRAATLGLNSAYRAIALGRLNEAEELLDEVNRLTRTAWVRRLVAIQKALISIRRGDLAIAKEELNQAIELPITGKFKSNATYQIEGAHAMRAFVLAGLGDREAALVDVRWVREQPQPSPEALARVALAEAILLERAGERDALREIIDRERHLLLEHTHPRERAIVRAFQRMLKVQQKSVYRLQAAPSELNGEEPELDDWVAKIAPNAAQFVRKGRKDPNFQHPNFQFYADQQQQQATHMVQQAAVHQAATQQFTQAPTIRHNTKSSTQRKILKVLGAVGAMALGIGAYNLISGTEVSPPIANPGPFIEAPPPTPMIPDSAVWVLVGVVAMGIAIYFGMRRAHRTKLQREVLRPGVRIATDAASASAASSSPDLTALTEGPDDVLAAQGHMLLAVAAEKRGEWLRVLEECDKGLGRLWSPENRQQADILFPDLVSLRAFGLACIGRFADAEVALSSLGATYPHLERALFRVRLVELLQMGRMREAAAYAEMQALELPLSVREELLSDLVRTVMSPEASGLGEVARLREEIEKTDHARAWVASIAPNVIGAFQQSMEADLTGIAVPKLLTEEEEAAAEIEADLAMNQLSPRLQRT